MVMESVIILTISFFSFAFFTICQIKKLVNFQKQLYATCSAISKDLKEVKSNQTKVQGILNKTIIRERVNAEVGSRAFNMASASQIGLASLQKAVLVKKPYRSPEQQLRESQTYKEIDKQFGGDDINDYLYAALDDEERDVLDNARQHFSKFKQEE